MGCNAGGADLDKRFAVLELRDRRKGWYFGAWPGVFDDGCVHANRASGEILRTLPE